MSVQSWQEVITNQIAAGTAFGSFTTAKTVINAQALVTLPPGYLTIGKMLSVNVRGSLSTYLDATPGTVTFQVMVGSVIAFTTGAIQMNVSGHTALPFWLDIDLTVRAVGASTSANMMGQGKIAGKMFCITAGQSDSADTHNTTLVPTTAPAVGTGFDSTIANILDFFAGFSVNNATNIVTIQQYRVTSLN